MAHKKRKERSQQRDVFTPSLDSLLLEPVVPAQAIRETLRPILEDRREFHPQGIRRPARSVFVSDSRLREQSSSRTRKVQEGVIRKSRGPQLSGRMSFRVPERVYVCVRRKVRREVIFAKLKQGKGARARRRRNEWSDISCR